MARVTVEDCVDKVPNRFELVLLAAHRARSIANGSAITVPVNDDKNPVIALREIADRTIPPRTCAKPSSIPSRRTSRWTSRRPSRPRCMPPDRRAPVLGRDDPTSDAVVDVMTEEQLLRGLESMTPTEPSANGGPNGGGRERERDRDRDRGR